MKRFRGLSERQLRELSPAAMNIARKSAHARRLMHWLVAALFVGLAIGVASYPVTLFYSEEIGLPEADADVIATATAALIFILWAIGFKIAQGAARPTLLAIWLRRFHLDGDDRFPLALMFNEISSWGILACTLSDTAVDKSDDAEGIVRSTSMYRAKEYLEDVMTRRYIRAALSFLLVGPLILVAVISAFAITHSAAITTGFLLAALAATGFLYLRYLLAPLKGHRRKAERAAENAIDDMFVVRADNARTYFQSVSSDLKQKKNPIRRGLLVLRVADGDWQIAVAEALKVADAVLMDVSEITENVAWELETVARMVEPQKILLSLAVPQGTDWRDHPSCARIAAWFGDGWQDRHHVFVYAETIDPKKRLTVARAEMPRFMSKIYEAAAGSIGSVGGIELD